MPLILNTPVSTATVTEIKILNCYFGDLHNPNGPICSIEFAEGTSTSGEFVSYNVRSVEISRAAVAATLAELPDPNKSIVTTFKEKLYSLLVSEGHVGSGNIT